VPAGLPVLTARWVRRASRPLAERVPVALAPLERVWVGDGSPRAALFRCPTAVALSARVWGLGFGGGAPHPAGWRPHPPPSQGTRSQPHGWSRSAVHRGPLMHRGQGDKGQPSLSWHGVAVQVGSAGHTDRTAVTAPTGRPPLGVADLDCPRWRRAATCHTRQRQRGLTDWWTGSSNRSQRHRWAAWRFDAVWRWSRCTRPCTRCPLRAPRLGKAFARGLSLRPCPG
jgi:hypothetical protein